MLGVVFVLCAGILMSSPNRVADWFPRGLAVPLLLGAWLPFLSLLSGIGRHYRAPVITGVAAAFAVLTFLFGDNHSVRRIDAAHELDRQPDIAAMPLNRAVELWIDANKCKQDPAKMSQTDHYCSGGAAQAGLVSSTASIIVICSTRRKKRTRGSMPPPWRKRRLRFRRCPADRSGP